MPLPDSEAATHKLASATPSATATTTAATVPSQPVPRIVHWAAIVIAAALPVILFGTIIIVVVSLNYNFLEWME